MAAPVVSKVSWVPRKGVVVVASLLLVVVVPFVTLVLAGLG